MGVLDKGCICPGQLRRAGEDAHDALYFLSFQARDEIL